MSSPPAMFSKKRCKQIPACHRIGKNPDPPLLHFMQVSSQSSSSLSSSSSSISFSVRGRKEAKNTHRTPFTKAQSTNILGIIHYFSPPPIAPLRLWNESWDWENMKEVQQHIPKNCQTSWKKEGIWHSPPASCPALDLCKKVNGRHLKSQGNAMIDTNYHLLAASAMASCTFLFRRAITAAS